MKQLITNANGQLSRTQISICIYVLLFITLLVAHVIRGNVLTTHVLGGLGMLGVFLIVDRMDARHIDFKLSKDGAAVKVESHRENKP